MSILTEVDRSWSNIHQLALPLLARLDATLTQAFQTGEVEAHFQFYEGYRHPARQNHLFSKKKTRARAVYSAHQFGLGADFVPYVNGKWSWDESHPWGFLSATASSIGLCSGIAWDRPHVWHPLWDEVRRSL